MQILLLFVNIIVFDIILHIIQTFFGLLLTLIFYMLYLCIKINEIVMTIYFNNKRYRQINNHTEICTICFDELNNEQYVQLRCKHQFHNICIDNWFTKKFTCPNCRYILND